jgi:hypothetical protein
VGRQRLISCLRVSSTEREKGQRWTVRIITESDHGERPPYIQIDDLSRVTNAKQHAHSEREKRRKEHH